MALATASLGGVMLPLDPEKVGWRSTTKTQSTNTVGGKVVQVYGTSISEVNIMGSYGSGGFQSAQAFLDQVTAWVDAQVGVLAPGGGKQGQGVWNGSPLQFIFPFRNWNFPVYILKFYNPQAAQSIMIDPRVVNYHWALSLYVASDNGSLSVENDASMLQYINNLSGDFGWFPNEANGNVQPGQYPQLVPLTSTTGTGNG